MALSPIEDSYLQRLTSSQFPDMPASEPAMPVDAAALDAPSMDGMQLAAGPSQTVSDAGAGRGSYAGFDPRLDMANKGQQDQMRAYDPTTRERIASFLQAGFEGLGMDRYKARQNAQTLIGGGSSNLPLDMGLADIVPFLGTALQTEEAVNMGGEAVQSAKQGNYGTAALQAGGAVLGLVPGAAGTVKAAKGLKNLPVGMSTQAVGGMDGVLTQTAKATAPVNDMGFYSAVEQAALNIQRKSGTGQAMLNDITKGQDVKLDEVKWIGLDDFLKGKKNVTREEVQQFIAANKVDVQEVTLGEQGVMEARQMAVDDITETLKAGDMFDDDAQWALKTWQESQPGSRLENQARVLLEEKLIYAGENRTVADFLDAGAAQTDSTKFGAYTLPGGENYREILLTLPENFGAKPNKDGYTPLSAITDAQYKSSHWEQPNVLAHIRVNDRVDADGKKMLLVEEVQSDWHQAGRDKGYGPKMETTVEAYYETKAGQRIPIGFGKTKEEAEASIDVGWKNMVDIKYDTIERKVGEGVPDAPMKDTWYQLALKRVLKYAADNGYERVGLTTGKTNAERFDLSKQVDSLLYSKNDDGTYKVSAQIQGRGQMLGESIPEAKLADYVGKEVAENMAKGVGNRTEVAGNYDPVSMTQGPRKYMTELSGDGLKVGGEGMKKYYDEVYPQFLSKYGKKWGAKVGETRIETEQSPKSWAYFRDWFAANHSDVGGSSTALAQWESGEKSKYVREFLKQNKAQEPVRFVDITPEMRQGVGKGQPLFTATGIGAGTTGATMQDKEQK